MSNLQALSLRINQRLDVEEQIVQIKTTIKMAEMRLEAINKHVQLEFEDYTVVPDVLLQNSLALFDLSTEDLWSKVIEILNSVVLQTEELKAGIDEPNDWNSGIPLKSFLTAFADEEDVLSMRVNHLFNLGVYHGHQIRGMMADLKLDVEYFVLSTCVRILTLRDHYKVPTLTTQEWSVFNEQINTSPAQFMNSNPMDTMDVRVFGQPVKAMRPSGGVNGPMYGRNITGFENPQQSNLSGFEQPKGPLNSW